MKSKLTLNPDTLEGIQATEDGFSFKDTSVTSLAIEGKNFDIVIDAQSNGRVKVMVTPHSRMKRPAGVEVGISSRGAGTTSRAAEFDYVTVEIDV